MRKIIRLMALFVAVIGVASCTLKGEIQDISNAEVSFVSPSQITYINKTNYDFKFHFDSSNIGINAQNAVVEVYESTSCDTSTLVKSLPLSPDGANVDANITGLQDGKRYSARVIVKNKDKIFQSPCSDWVGIDLQKPNPVAVNFPASNNYVALKEVMTAWTASTDNGISGLSEVPYRLRLYGLANCAGPILQTADSAEQQYKFKKLTQGVTYSVQVSALDKASNESVLSCSPYTEVDVYAPTFRFEDPTSIDGYSRSINPNVYITNDAAAAYWCLTTNLTFAPTSYTDACPSGHGSTNGWYTSRPTDEMLASGDGLKSYNLWIVRGDGSLISNKKTSAAITLDQTLPGSFTVAGIGGITDSIFDAWLTSSGNPTIRWNPSTDAVDYTIEVYNASNSVVCLNKNVPPTPQEFSLTNCTSLASGQTYKARITSYDVARNYRVAPDFPFVVDLTSPDSFSITGVLGGSDTLADAFLGVGLPTVQYQGTTGATHNTIEIKDATGSSTICTLGDEASPGGSFNYATAGGVSCAALVNGSTYRVYVSALNAGGTVTAASNNGFSFQVDTTVPTLTIDSHPPTLTSDTFANFTFTASDALSGIGSVKCRLDGGSFADCSSPINLTGVAEGTHTYEIKVTDKVGNVTSASSSWQVDLSNPVLTILTRPPNYSNSLAAGISFSATDAAGIAGYTCGLDGASPTSCASPMNFVVAEGSHSMLIRATDNTGFYDEKTVTWFADLTNPVLTITSQPPAFTTDSHISIGFSATDAAGIAGYTCAIDGATASSCSSPFTFTATEGAHSVLVRATDNTGYYDEKTVTFRLDTTNPVLTITSQPAAHTTNPNISIGFTATDSAGIASYECAIDGASLSVCSSPLTFTGAEGAHSVVVRATDNTGFYDEKTVTFYVDTTAPVLTINSKPAAYTTSTSASISFSATDADGIAGYTCAIDGAGAGACTSALTFTAAEGIHSVTIRATDLAGLYDEKIVTFRVDNTNPVLTITAQPAAYTTDPNASISFVASDAAGIAGFTCKVDAAAAAACTSPFTFTAAEGAHTVVVKATDNTGLSDTKTVTFTVDRINPTVTITSGPANPTHGTTSGSVAFTVTDANPTTTTCSLDGAAYTACSSPVAFSGLSAGSHTMTVKATDGAGNVGTSSYTWTLYTYTWIASSWAGCTAAQPNWSTGGWGSCSAAQPAYAYSGWGGCSAPCNTGSQTRTESCPTIGGTQTRTVSCPISSGAETRTAQCQRNDTTIVADGYCDAPSKPTTSQTCTRNDCAGGAPSGSQACTRGGGSDCYGAQATSQACNTAACQWRSYDSVWRGGNCPGYTAASGACAPYGTFCSYQYQVHSGKAKGKGSVWTTYNQSYQCLQ